MRLFDTLQKWGTLRRLSKDIHQLKAELIGLRSACERIAEGIEAANRLSGASDPLPRDPAAPVVDITYVDNQVAGEFMDIELRLTQARGMVPTEDEILQEFERRHVGAGVETQ